MKFISALLLTGAILMASSPLFAQGKRSKPAIPSSDILVSMKLVSAPSIQVQDKAETLGDSLAVGKSIRKWVQIHITYRFSNSVSDTIYEDMKVEAFLRTPVPGGGYAWFTGNQYLHCVIADSDRHNVALYLPPSMVYRYVSQSKSTKDVLKRLDGIVILSDKDDNILGMKVFTDSSSKLTRTRETDILTGLKNINQAKYKFVDAIWPKENTPWQWIDADRYDLPRPVLPNRNVPEKKKIPAPAVSADDETGE